MISPRTPVGTLVRIQDSVYGNPNYTGVYTVVRIWDGGRSFDLVRGNIPEREALALGWGGDFDINVCRERLVPALTTV